jgi:hypothetical protein
MLYEHWTKVEDDGKTSDVFIPADSPQREWLTSGQLLRWTVEADSWEQAMALCHEHMGWDPYVPMEDSGSS